MKPYTYNLINKQSYLICLFFLGFIYCFPVISSQMTVYRKAKFEQFREKISKSYDVNKQDAEGNTLLHNLLIEKSNIIEGFDWPSSVDVRDAVEASIYDELYLYTDFLLRKGSNPNLQNNQGKTAMHLGILCGYPPLIDLLITSQGDIHVQDFVGNTPLHIALSTQPLTLSVRLFDIVEKLLSRGARADIPNHAGKYPFEVLTERVIASKNDDTPIDFEAPNRPVLNITRSAYSLFELKKYYNLFTRLNINICISNPDTKDMLKKLFKIKSRSNSNDN